MAKEEILDILGLGYLEGIVKSACLRVRGERGNTQEMENSLPDKVDIAFMLITGEPILNDIVNSDACVKRMTDKYTRDHIYFFRIPPQNVVSEK